MPLKSNNSFVGKYLMIGPWVESFILFSDYRSKETDWQDRYLFVEQVTRPVSPGKADKTQEFPRIKG